MKRRLLNGTIAAALIASTLPVTFSPAVAKAEETAAVENVLKVRLLETTDVHGNMMDYDYYKDAPTIEFGLARTAELIKEAKAEVKNSLLFDNGDLLQGNPLTDYVAKVKGLAADEVHPIYKAMNILDYDAATLGNHEFNYGLPFLHNALEEAEFPYVNANIYIEDNDQDETNDENAYRPYEILTRTFEDEAGNKHEVKIGVLGLVTPQIMQWDKGNLEGHVKTKDIVATAEKFVPEMKAAGAEIIVTLAHTGFDASAEAYTDAENAVMPLSKVEGIDAILFGHKHVVFPGTGSEFKVAGVDATKGTINGVAAVEAGNWGNNLGVIDLTLEKDAEGKWQVVDTQAAARPIFETVNKVKIPTVDGPDAEIVNAVKEAHDGTLNYVRGKIGTTTAPMYSFFARVQDDPTIQIVNNAQKWYVEKYINEKLPEYKDVPVLSAGAPFKAGRQGPSDYTNIAKGDLSIKSANDLYLYPNTLKAVELTGAQVKEWLEMSAGQFNQINPASTEEQELINYSFEPFNYDVIDGLKYEIDVTQPAKYKTDGSINDASASRIKNLTMPDGTPVDPEQKFVVVTNNYRASGGGNFPGLSGSKLVVDSADENRQVLMDYISEQGEINPSADQNWKIATPGENLKLTFKSTPDAQSVANGNVKFLDTFTDEKGTWGKYELDLTTVDVQLLGINDFHGQINITKKVSNRNAGRADYLAAYLKEREAANPENTFMLHAGDAVGASAPASALLQDEPTIEILNKIGFDLGTLGNHEFDEGVEEMMRLINGGTHEKTGDFAGANFPYVAANVVNKETGELILNPYEIKEFGGVPVGFIGVVYSDTPSIVTPSGTAGVEFTDEVDAINKYTLELKAQGVKAIVVVSHNPGQSKFDGTDATGEVVDFANKVDDEVDVIFAGHSHQYLNSVVDGKLLVQAYSSGTAFADVDLTLDVETKDFVSKKAEIVTTFQDSITPDPEIKAMVDKYEADVAPIINEVIGSAEVAMTREQNEHGESTLGNLIADAMRVEMGTDFAFMNPGGIRADLDAGEITWGELFTIQPFGNDLVKMTLTGAEIRELLNQQFNPDKVRMLQLSGLSYEWSDELEYGEKVLDIYLPSGELIDEEADYTVTVNNFMAGGGDNYTALLKGRDQFIGPTDLDGLVNYIKANGTVGVGIEDRVLKVELEDATGWVLLADENGNEYWGFIDPETGELVTSDWLKYDGDWYYFDEEGIMATGWIKVKGKWYYLSEKEDNLGALETGWQKHGNRWHYFDEDGNAKLGWFRVGGKWYYFDPSSAEMKTGWVKWSNQWYFLDAGNGDMKTGWVKTGGKWYMLGKDGAMKTGWVKSGKDWYYLNAKTGAMATGWVKDKGKWYFLDGSGAMKTGWVKTGGKWYYLFNDGSMAVNTKVGKYKVGKDGAWIQ
ncbi:bifunctional 2',3'-cyclic-nucleotide 2'-phosphodiesterase/3'-nucleotidase [Mesobacillus boroniphilus]|uniref:Bifunctional 2',3'-cyclic-nucleotide 2'-phosphodiesterase/3'-nucleotidase n=2 Tax=Mesobacillus boroniphilus TaxID=308892 RepID=A0A944CMW7_9BACI|nr:bifunctional 2',3'-cyclic-nucleotide 2'-phosphodiesterase/3'-nucleotidase [Mesobacillus boroniphilus]MBS8265737.1 bifunctional 2',3'-cyclic-nucleotide 2'-phosphodiesterase/3'-nucleotidase [Mesobacillus boroniphilus]